jgi:hypothetical protein
MWKIRRRPKFVVAFDSPRLTTGSLGLVHYLRGRIRPRRAVSGSSEHGCFLAGHPAGGCALAAATLARHLSSPALDVHPKRARQFAGILLPFTPITISFSRNLLRRWQAW